ncbi:MAG: hypothetical protein ABGX05_17660, partial [Pirellulaceae bacterium]
MSKPVVWFVGRVDHEEFAPALQWLEKYTRLGVSATVDEALQVLESGGPRPGAIVLGQSRRGEFSQQDQEKMLRCAPLAEALVLLGSWCEGETRSGSPAAGWHRVYWHQFVD